MVELWAEVEQYLALASLVQALSTTHDGEGTRDEHNSFDCTPERDPQQRFTRMGSVLPGTPAGADPGSGGPAAATAPAHDRRPV